MLTGQEIFILQRDINLVRSVLPNPYDKKSAALQAFKNIQEALTNLVLYSAQRLNIPLTICRKEKFNKQAGRAASHNNWTDYILVGAFPGTMNASKSLFIKFEINSLPTEPTLRIELDCDFASDTYGVSRQIQSVVNSLKVAGTQSHEVNTLYGKTLSEIFDLTKDGLNQSIIDYQPAYNAFRPQGLFNQVTASKSILHRKETLNTIFYGPPGTGKTRKMQKLISEWELVNTDSENDPDYFTFVQGYKWWEIVALALLQEEKVTVPELLENELIQAKLALSNITNPRARMWSVLQNHTSDECPNVHLRNKSGAELIFYKEEDSQWRLHNEEEFRKDFEVLISEFDELTESTGTDAGKKHYTFTTCHQSLSYEDFIEGIKPALRLYDTDDFAEEEGIKYELKKGLFYQACDKAAQRADYLNLAECLKDSVEGRAAKFSQAIEQNAYHVIFLDEINRCNVSAVFGELITLIESDKRLGAENEIADTVLPYSNDLFGVPANLIVVGTMNTADRSVEALDAALRRRFSFEFLEPKPSLITFESNDFKLADAFKIMNERIAYLLDEDHQIGHSYLMHVSDEPQLRLAFEKSIIPLLKEYFYNDHGKIRLILGDDFFEEKKAPIFASDTSEEFLMQKQVNKIKKIVEDFPIIAALKKTLKGDTA